MQPRQIKGGTDLVHEVDFKPVGHGKEGGAGGVLSLTKDIRTCNVYMMLNCHWQQIDNWYLVLRLARGTGAGEIQSCRVTPSPAQGR